jgi:hypothetical protein
MSAMERLTGMNLYSSHKEVKLTLQYHFACDIRRSAQNQTSCTEAVDSRGRNVRYFLNLRSNSLEFWDYFPPRPHQRHID